MPAAKPGTDQARARRQLAFPVAFTHGAAPLCPGGIGGR
jgi:hypothetical protein